MVRNFFLCSLVTFATIAHAAEPARSVDASQFDVSGVKLGMSAAEAVAAASTKLQIDKRAIEFDKFPKVNLVTKSRQPEYFTATNGSGKLTVYFYPNIPPDKSNQMLVGLVKYEMPWTPENARSMKAAAIDKFGPPSNGTIGASTHWCLNPDKNLGNGCGEFQGPKLTLSGVSMELQNPAIQQAITDYINKSQSTKPAF